MSSFVITRALEPLNELGRGAGINDLFTEGYRKKTLDVLLRVGDQPVRSMVVVRSPLPAAMEAGINSIASGQWVELKHKYGYDTFFHLAIIAAVDSGKILIEKNAYGINVADFAPYDDAEYMTVNIEKWKTPPSIITLLDKTEDYLKGNYFSYSPFRNNCQNFIYSLLMANDLKDEEVTEFVFQPLDELIKELPAYVEPLVDVAAQAYGIQTLLNEE